MQFCKPPLDVQYVKALAALAPPAHPVATHLSAHADKASSYVCSIRQLKHSVHGLIFSCMACWSAGEADEDLMAVDTENAGGDPEAEAELLDPVLEAEAEGLVHRLGVGCFKQWCLAGAWMQLVIENLVYGGSKNQPITRQTIIKQKTRKRTQEENERKEATYVDAARGLSLISMSVLLSL